MKSPIKVIIKEPGKAPRYEEIENDLETLQTIVGGYIETVTLYDTVIICDEEGRLNGKAMNCRFYGLQLCGTIILAGIDGEEFADVPDMLSKLDDLLLFQARCCPKCGSWYEDAPAISREDNETEICPDCGQAEAMAEYARHKREAQYGAE